MSTSSSTTEPLNAPRYGTVVPKRIFVGGISASTTEAELQDLFSRFGPVTNAKIILDRAGVSKGYGFVTFDTEEDAQRAQATGRNLTLRDRRLNIAPAIKKQPFRRVYDPTQSVPNGTILYHNGVPYTYHNGMAFFITPEAMCQTAPPTYPLIYQPSVYYPQHAFQYQNVQVASQWASGNLLRWNTSSNGNGATYPPPLVSPYCGTESPEYCDPAIIEASAEGDQRPVGGARPRREGTPRCSPPSYTNGGNGNLRGGSGDTRRHPPSSRHHHMGVMVPKLVNGVAVLACPTTMSLPNGTGGTVCSPQVPPLGSRSAPKGPPWTAQSPPADTFNESVRGLGL